MKWLADELVIALEDPNIACVFLDSSVAKGFCAGGDVKFLYSGIHNKNIDDCLDFFTTEYSTDYLIHICPKPIICWAHGVTMGGGIGIMNGCTHRIVSEKTLMAMPEVLIGLFPDVGASYFLNHLNYPIGKFLALTAAKFTGKEAFFLGLADYYFDESDKIEIIAALERFKWSNDIALNKKNINDFLRDFTPGEQDLESPYLHRLDEILELQEMEQKSSLEFALKELSKDDRFWTQHYEDVKYSSPLSFEMTKEQMNRHENYALKEVFIAEWEMATSFCKDSDFYEGVRALLVDKDKKPQWREKHHKADFYFQSHYPKAYQKFLQKLDEYDSHLRLRN